MERSKTKLSFNNPKIFGVFITIILSLLLVVQLKINKIQNVPNDWSNVNNATEIRYVSSKRKNMMLDPAVKLSILSFAQDTKPIISSNGILLGSATGVSVNYDKKTNTTYILTNNHFCEDFILDPTLVMAIEDSRAPRINNPDENMLIGTILKTDPGLDLCLVLTKGHIRPANIAKKNIKLKKFESVFIIGGPTGIFPTIIDTYLSGKLDRSEVALPRLSKDGHQFLFLSGLIFPGHSGSPVYNNRYELIGIVFASMPSYGAIAIALEDIYQFLEI